MDSTGNAASAPPCSMEILDSLCEHCYGLAMDCLYCSNVGTQRTVNSWDPGQFSHLESPSHYHGDSHASTGGYVDYSEFAPILSQTDRAKYLQLTNTLSSNTADGSAEKVSCDEPTQVLEVERGEQVPAYRRHTKSKAQVKLLREWFGINPTPTGQQLFEYAKLAGLEKDQVRNWFVNQRRPSRRPKPKTITREKTDSQQNRDLHVRRSLHKELDSSPMATTEPIPIAGRSSRSSLTDSLRSIPNMPESMLERWHNSPPDEEPANLCAIRNAVQSSEKLEKNPSLAQEYSPRLRAKKNVMVLIENIPLDMKMHQFVQIMLLKDIRRPRTFHYEFKNGIFGGLAFAEFRSMGDATFAISRLDHILLEGCTLYAQLESPMVGPAPWSQNKATYHAQRTDSWRSAPSTDGSAASSAARSTSSSISFARRRYKEAYRVDYQQQDAFVFEPIYQEFQPYFSDSNLLGHRPPTPIPPAMPGPSADHNSICDNAFGMDGVEFCDEPDKIVGTNAEEPHIQTALGEISAGSKYDEELSGKYHSCQRYHCESCTQKFNAEEDWRAHETLIHRPREEWVCSLVPCMKPTMKDWKCAFCQSPFSDWTKFVLHDCRPCGIAPMSVLPRPVFNTRTDLADHVKHYHGGAVLTPFMVEKWSRPPTWEEGIWACSTCGSSVQGWQNRLDHLAGHYRLEISKKKCSCLRIPTIQVPKPRSISGEMQISSVSSVNAEDKRDDAPISDHEAQEVSSFIKHSDPVVSSQSGSYGFVAQARAWITRSMRRP